ncbi:hypothetical protein N2M06_13450 [Oceanimonas sp. AH20CE76]|uniref:hypothetical protein n=1 Tax=Oceanimonas sp. AH20CE76 TaxID=2977120 RepID=UPI0031FF381F
MMSIKYYKTKEPAVIAAYQQMMADTQDLLERATVFCAEFDAEPVIGQDVNGYRFYGLRFNNYGKREDKHLWTKPNPREGLLSSVRSRAPGYAAELRALKAKVEQHWPQPSTVSKDGLYKSLGTNWGSMLVCGGIGITEHNETLYLATQAKIHNCIEITGTEYEQAQRDAKEPN